MKTSFKTCTLAAALILSALSAHASDGKSQQPHLRAYDLPDHDPIGEPPGDATPDRTVDITVRETGSGYMLFDPDALHIENGAVVRFRVTNSGKLDHTFFLGSFDEVTENRQWMQEHPDMTHDAANFISIPSGETGELIWKFSDVTNLEFACLVPGHRDAGCGGSSSCMITSPHPPDIERAPMSLMDRYHVLVHDVSALFGYDYNDTTPDWVHPFIHLILVLAPGLLIGVALYLVLRGILRLWSRPAKPVARMNHVRGLDAGLFSSVLRYTRRQQAQMIMLSLLALPILYLTLELPKQIVNNALESATFPVEVLGQSLDQVIFLLLLCGLYLLSISLNGLIKYTLNVFKGYTAERFLRRFRLLIYRRWRSDAEASEQSEIVPILAQEVEPIGGFAAEVLTLPVLQGGTLFTILLFMFIQDPILGAAALTVLPIQLILLPKLQRRVNTLSRIRIKEVRDLGRQLSEQLRERQGASSGLSAAGASFKALEQVRRRIFRLKFFIKALNNFLTALTPFLFYSLGGYFVIEGRITLGALVAVLAALASRSLGRPPGQT